MRLQPLAGAEQAFAVPLDGDLEATGEALGLGLSLAELEKVRDHFRDEGRVPTDVELQAIDQAWSEHCCYKSSSFCDVSPCRTATGSSSSSPKPLSRRSMSRLSDRSGVM